MNISGIETDLLQIIPELENVDGRKLGKIFSIDFNSHLKAVEFDYLAAESGLDKENLLRKLAELANNFALASVSGKKIGAALETEEGDVFLGANIEFEKISPKFTIHAEQSAAINANNNGARAFRRLAVDAVPCGICRQFFTDFPNAKNIHFLTPEGDFSLADLLPHPFELDHAGTGVEFDNIRLDVENPDPMTTLAFEAVKNSYSPYTGYIAAASIRTYDGKIFSGAYFENAAFNPTITGLQASIISLVMSGGKLDKIAEAVVVRNENSVTDISFFESYLLKMLADVELRRYGLVLD